MERTLDAILTFLLKYPPRLYQRGDLSLAPSFPPRLIALALGVALILLLLTLRRVRTPAPIRDRLVLGVLRAALFGLLGFCLLRPVLLLSSAVPQRNLLGILLDDSRSM